MNHVCPCCKRDMIWFMDTLLCPICDAFQIEILSWRHKEIKKEK